MADGSYEGDSAVFNPNFSPYATVTFDLDDTQPDAAPWLPASHEEASYLCDLFPSLVRVANGKMSVAQTFLVASAGVHHCGSQRSTIMTWDRVEEHLRANDLHRHLKLSHRCRLVVILLDTGFPFRDIILGRYNDVEGYISRNPDAGVLTVYPTREEAQADGYKLPDIRILDAVAAKRRDWRPVTCFGNSTCALSGVRTFNKRSWSGCSLHAGRNVRPRLTCFDPVRGPGPVDEASKESWFHQEFVDFLSLEEFRVFIVTKPDPEGVRGLKGEVHKICLTKTFPDSQIGASRPPEASFKRRGFTGKQVMEYALGVFESLRELNSPQLGSLDIGCRLDVAARHHGGPLFINEITRWYGAHDFTDYCDVPGRMTCEQYAMAFSAAVKRDERGPDGEGRLLGVQRS
ncbi:unnamed protein product [Colletotrichum noveboracense]|uniref:Uncharacterized protein n=1 Tax=Colletotrichum noveboracense TaxID=2664923 RepID=A0A9W4WD93_9PEZI|nr:hypothetical protein K456DRAFT_43033 [Colletotrichum gloeosporioides 23]KAJ0267962.1 hypothetical protein COL940_013857 [Colletotrichum noveboracense]KAJ0271203.1 hypothetical protein CBS470a_013221 [Colletotrichum nupharicola]KAJ0311653.1 hypothetical protein Brms1b_008171 [Colletotrichum noveboracense]CAI0651703.1 unnamed protein product [Colletotrichum noveboracense]